MTALFSRQCEYALQAVIYLALRPAGEMTPAKELTKRLKVPYHFISKILQDLTRKKLLVSLKGPTGGFGLAIAPEKITLFQIVEAIDGDGFTRSCALGFKECSDHHPCSVHDTWKDLREGIHHMLVSRNIAELARGMKQPGYSSARGEGEENTKPRAKAALNGRKEK